MDNNDIISYRVFTKFIPDVQHVIVEGERYTRRKLIPIECIDCTLRDGTHTIFSDKSEPGVPDRIIMNQLQRRGVVLEELTSFKCALDILCQVNNRVDPDEDGRPLCPDCQAPGEFYPRHSYWLCPECGQIIEEELDL
mgnify:CR=1 FL=1